MSNQRIDCNVTDCMHNCLEDCSCRLDKIQVCPCNSKSPRTPEDETACSMYIFSGDLNTREHLAGKQQI